MSAVPVIETLFKPLNKDKVRALYQEQQKQAIKYLENEDMPFNECANALRKGLEIVNLAYYYFPQEFKKDYKQYRAFVEKIKLFPVASIEKESAAAKEKIDSIHQFLKREVTQPIVLYVPPSDSTHTLLVTACEQFSKTDPSYAVFYVDFSSFYSLQDETEINAKYVTILKAFYQQYEQYIKDVDIKEIFQDDQALINHKQPLVILAKEILKRSGKKIILFIHGIDLIEINEKLEILRRLAAIDICFEKSIAIAAARKVRAWEVWKNQQTIYLTNETKGNMKKLQQALTESIFHIDENTVSEWIVIQQGHSHDKRFIFDRRVIEQNAEESIDAGAFGKVWRHRLETRKDTTVVIKRPLGYNKRKCLANFQVLTHEVSSLIPLKHPNIVQFLGLTSSGFPVLTAEPYDLERYYTEPGKFLTDALDKLLQDMLAALVYLHQLGLFHGDINLKNILFDPLRRRYKLADGGSISSEDYIFEVGHTLILAAPEILIRWYLQYNQDYPPPYITAIKDKIGLTGKVNGPLTDIYSLGLVVYMLLTGRLPYGSDNNKAYIQNMLFHKGPKDISKMFHPIVRACLAFYPQDRLNAKSLQEKLTEYRKEATLLEEKITDFVIEVAAIFLEEEVLKQFKPIVDFKDGQWWLRILDEVSQHQSVIDFLKDCEIYSKENHIEKYEYKVNISFLANSLKELIDPSYLLMELHARHLKARFMAMSKRNHFSVDTMFVNEHWFISILLHKPEFLQPFIAVLTQSRPILNEDLTIEKNKEGIKVTFSAFRWADVKKQPIHGAFGELFDEQGFFKLPVFPGVESIREVAESSNSI